jgi:hypothetical protein
VYAVVRVDQPSDSVTPIEDTITVKEILWSLEEAQAEVARLMELNESKGCKYFWQTTRLIDHNKTEGSSD